MTKKFIVGIPNKHNIPMKRSHEIIIKKKQCAKKTTCSEKTMAYFWSGLFVRTKNSYEMDSYANLSLKLDDKTPSFLIV